MTANNDDHKAWAATVFSHLQRRELHQALDLLSSEASNQNDTAFIERIAQMRETYRWMLNYLIQGAPDPERQNIYAKLMAQAYALTDALAEARASADSHDYVYTQKAILTSAAAGLDRLDVLEDSLEQTASAESLTALLDSANARHSAVEHEQFQKRLFNLVWLSADSVRPDLLRHLVFNPRLRIDDRALAVSALTLYLFRRFDESLILILCDLCEASDDEVSQRALVALLPLLVHYDSRLLWFTQLEARVRTLFDSSHLRKAALRVLMQMIRTNETPELVREMKDEIIPRMTELAKNLRPGESVHIISDDPDEMNPEWAEMLDKSGLGERLQKFSELQMEGSDVYLTTFSTLKQFPFFSDVCNWFLPFSSRRSEICEVFADEKDSSASDRAGDFLSLMLDSGVMCSSDRYSFCLSLLQVAPSQRELMRKAFSMEKNQQREILAEDDVLGRLRRVERISNTYIQDLYRFFNLFPARSAFFNPLSTSLRFHQARLASLIGWDDADRLEIAEYAFSKKLWNLASHLFRSVGRTIESGANLCQKIGYCSQRLGKYDDAVSFYLQAEIFSPNNRWTLQKLAWCYRTLSQWDNALDVCRKLLTLQPDNLSVLTQIGYCLMELQRWDEAQETLFRVEYALPGDAKACRAIAWTALRSSDFPRAAKYAARTIGSDQSLWQDYLVLGHVQWAQGHLSDALKSYSDALRAADGNFRLVSDALRSDTPVLAEAGIDTSILPMVLDALRPTAS